MASEKTSRKNGSGMGSHVFHRAGSRKGPLGPRPLPTTTLSELGGVRPSSSAATLEWSRCRGRSHATAPSCVAAAEDDRTPAHCLLQHRRMELLPIVEVVQANGVFWRA